jgi:hypothetical protein
MDKQAMMKSFTPGDLVTILTTNGEQCLGRLTKFDLNQGTFTLETNVYREVDMKTYTAGAVKSDHPVDYKLDDIDTILKAGVAPPAPKKHTIDEELKPVPIGKYLMIWGKHGASLSPTIEQGRLISIDWTKRTLVLRSVTYENQDTTVYFDKISFIDYSRSGPGAQGSAQTPDWHLRPDGAWYRGNREYGTNDDE